MTQQLIPQAVKHSLQEKKYSRPNPSAVLKVLNNLDATPHSLLQSFFEAYEGSFWSEKLGYELLDLLEGEENIQTSTNIAREKFEFSKDNLVLTRISSGQVVVLNTTEDKLYEVDFEGGEKLFNSGEIQPRWNSFRDFLIDYF